MKIGLFQPKIQEVPETGEAAIHYKLNFSGPDSLVFNNGSLKNKVVFINFWATWCPPCIAEMPSIEALYSGYKDHPDVVFLFVDADNDPAKAERFLAEQDLRLPVVQSLGEIPPHWYSGTLPTTIVLDRNGKPVYRHEGAADYNSKKFRAFLEGLLQ